MAGKDMKAKAKVAIETLLRNKKEATVQNAMLIVLPLKLLPGKAGAEVTPSEPLNPKMTRPKQPSPETMQP